MKHQHRPLMDLIKVHYGKALKQEDRIESGNWPVYGSSGQLGNHNLALTQNPTIIIGRKGSVGEITYAPQGGWTIDTAFYTEITDPRILDLRYLFYALKKANLITHTITTSIPGINRDNIYGTQIPLPPMAEQKRIAAILDKADAIRRKRQAAIKLADDFLRATFLDLFGDPVTNPKGWEVNPLEKLVNFRTGKIDSNAAVAGGCYPFFTCSRENFQIDTYAFDCEALLLAGNNAAAEYSVKYYKGKFNAYQRTYVITTKGDFLTYRYLQHAIELKLKELKRLSKGTNTKYLTLGILNAISIQVPNKETLHSFDRVLSRVEKQKGLLQNSSQLADQNFNSLTQRAFRGEL